jgi:nicotine blue oxidoreductase
VIAGIVLAAGAATRFGAPKQRLLIGDVLARVEAAGLDEVVVVEGAHRLGAGTAAARVVSCPEWERGPGASLRCGLAELSPAVEAAVVVLADGPDLSAAAIERVVEGWRSSGETVVAASYGGERGHPLVLDRRAWEQVPDEGLRAWEPHLVPCDDLGSPGDVDTPADLPERFR